MPHNLIHEWLALPDLTEAQHCHLEQIGVTRKAVALAGGLAWVPVAVVGRLFQPTATGPGALVMAAWSGSPPSIFQAVQDPQITDLIAFHPAQPEIWWRRLGVPGAVLGADHLDLAHARDLPVSLVSTPLEWLQGNCRGAVLLDYAEDHWTAERYGNDLDALSRWWRAAA